MVEPSTARGVGCAPTSLTAMSELRVTVRRRKATYRLLRTALPALRGQLQRSTRSPSSYRVSSPLDTLPSPTHTTCSVELLTSTQRHTLLRPACTVALVKQTHKSAPKTAIHIPWNGKRQYSVSASLSANQILASPVDRIPVQMIHCVGTRETSRATRTLQMMPDAEAGRKRRVAPTGPVNWTCWKKRVAW